MAQVTNLTIGKQYLLYATVNTINSSPSLRLQVSGIGLIDNSAHCGTGNTDVYLYQHFTASNTTHVIEVLEYSTDSANEYFTVDNIAWIEVEQDRSNMGNMTGTTRINKGVQMVGTVTKSAVATGADLVAYSGFNGSNYLKQPYNSAFDFGTGDFTYTFWHECGSSGSDRIWLAHGKYNTAGSGLNILQLNSAGSGDQAQFYIGNSGQGAITVTGVEGRGWQNWVVTRINGVLFVYRNGELEGRVANVGSVNLSNQAIDEMYIGAGYTGSSVFAYGATKLALYRVGNMGTSSDNAKQIYNDEKHLFKENAKATLGGSANYISAVDYDDDTELLHVGSSSGRSVFRGLNRVEYYTDYVPQLAISASNGMVAEE